MDKFVRNRAVASNKDNFIEYFKLLKSSYEKVAELNGKPVTADIVWNTDETGHTPAKTTKAIAVGNKSSTQNKLTTSESGIKISKLTSASASGKLAPEFYLMNGKRRKEGFTYQWIQEQGALEGSTIFVTPKGEMNAETWVKC